MESDEYSESDGSWESDIYWGSSRDVDSTRETMISQREFASLLRADILDDPDKLDKLATYLAWNSGDSGSPALDAFDESNIVHILAVPRRDALNVIVVLAKKCPYKTDLFCRIVNPDRLVKAIYDLLHVKADQGLVEDLSERQIIHDIFEPLSRYEDAMPACMLDAVVRNGLIEVFDTWSGSRDLFEMEPRSGKRITWEQQWLIFEECKSRFDRAHKGMCSLRLIQCFLQNLWAKYTRPKDLIGFKLDSHPLLIAEVLSHMHCFDKGVQDEVLTVWPNILEEIVDAVLEWPSPGHLNYREDCFSYSASLNVIVKYLRHPVHAKRFAAMDRAKLVELMKLTKGLEINHRKGCHWKHLGLPLILAMVKHTSDPNFRVQLIIYPWYESVRVSPIDSGLVSLARNALNELAEVEHFQHCPKYMLFVVANLVKAMLNFIEFVLRTKQYYTDSTEATCAAYFDKARAALKAYEGMGAFDHDYPGTFPDIFRPNKLKLFMLEHCEEFAKEYALYGDKAY